MTDRYYQEADYILNHYAKTSHMDKICLAKKLNGIYNSGLNTAITIVNEVVDDKEMMEVLVCALENSKKN